MVNKTELWDESVMRRLKALEKQSHEPFDFTHLIARLEAAEAKIDELQADVEYLRNATRVE